MFLLQQEHLPHCVIQLEMRRAASINQAVENFFFSLLFLQSRAISLVISLFFFLHYMIAFGALHTEELLLNWA